MKTPTVHLLALLSSALPMTAHAHLSNQQAPPGTGSIDTATVSAYAQAFSIWSSEKHHRSPKLPVPPIQADAPECTINCGIVGCPCGRLRPGPPTPVATATWPGKPTHRRTQSSSSMSTPTSSGSIRPLAVNVEEPTRTVIVRSFSSRETPPAQAIINEAPVDSQTMLSAEGTIPRSEFDEITSSLYALALSGYHPSVIPLIVSAPMPDSTTDTSTGQTSNPITILAYANTTIFSSFISSSLVSSLNLTASITPATQAPVYLPEHNLATLLGFATKSLGTISLDLLAGADDRLVPGAEFTVFQAPDLPRAGFRPDLYVGIEFLNMIDAFVLADEYSGSAEAGAKKGLGVLVQRVFTRDGKKGSLGGGKDEL